MIHSPIGQRRTRRVIQKSASQKSHLGTRSLSRRVMKPPQKVMTERTPNRRKIMRDYSPNYRTRRTEQSGQRMRVGNPSHSYSYKNLRPFNGGIIRDGKRIENQIQIDQIGQLPENVKCIVNQSQNVKIRPLYGRDYGMGPFTNPSTRTPSFNMDMNGQVQMNGIQQPTAEYGYGFACSPPKQNRVPTAQQQMNYHSFPQQQKMNPQNFQFNPIVQTQLPQPKQQMFQIPPKHQNLNQTMGMLNQMQFNLPYQRNNNQHHYMNLAQNQQQLQPPFVGQVLTQFPPQTQIMNPQYPLSMNAAMKFNTDAFLNWQKMQKEYFQNLVQQKASPKRKPLSDITNIPNLPKSQKSPYNELTNSPRSKVSTQVNTKRLISPDSSEPSSLQWNKRCDSFGKPPLKKIVSRQTSYGTLLSQKEQAKQEYLRQIYLAQQKISKKAKKNRMKSRKKSKQRHREENSEETYINTMNLKKLEKHLDNFTSGFTAPTYKTFTSGELPKKQKRNKSNFAKYKNQHQIDPEFYDKYLKQYIKQKQHEKLRKVHTYQSEDEMNYMSHAHSHKRPSPRPKKKKEQNKNTCKDLYENNYSKNPYTNVNKSSSTEQSSKYQGKYYREQELSETSSPKMRKKADKSNKRRARYQAEHGNNHPIYDDYSVDSTEYRAVEKKKKHQHKQRQNLDSSLLSQSFVNSSVVVNQEVLNKRRQRKNSERPKTDRGFSKGNNIKLTQEELKMIHYQRMKNQLKHGKSHQKSAKNTHEPNREDYFTVRGDVTKKDKSAHELRCSPQKEEEGYKDLVKKHFPQYSTPSIQPTHLTKPVEAETNPYMDHHHQPSQPQDSQGKGNHTNPYTEKDNFGPIQCHTKLQFPQDQQYAEESFPITQTKNPPIQHPITPQPNQKRKYREFNFDKLYQNFEKYNKNGMDIIGGFRVYHDEDSASASKYSRATNSKLNSPLQTPGRNQGYQRSYKNAREYNKWAESPIHTVQNINGLLIENVIRRPSYKPLETMESKNNGQKMISFNNQLENMQKEMIVIPKINVGGHRRVSSIGSRKSNGSNGPKIQVKSKNLRKRNNSICSLKNQQSLNNRDTVEKFPTPLSLEKKGAIDNHPFEPLVLQNKPREIVSQTISWKGINQQVSSNKPPTSGRSRQNSYSSTIKQLTRKEKYTAKAKGLMDQYLHVESKKLSTNIKMNMNIQPEKADSLNFQELKSDTNQIITSFGDANFY